MYKRQVEDDVATVVFLDDAGADMTAAHVGRRVEMGDETDCRNLIVDIALEGGHKIPVFIEGDVAETHCAKLLFEMLRENHLPRGRGGEIGKLVTLSVELHIF